MIDLDQTSNESHLNATLREMAKPVKPALSTRCCTKTFDRLAGALKAAFCPSPVSIPKYFGSGEDPRSPGCVEQVLI